MTDPTYKPEQADTLPREHPEPPQYATSTPLSQLEQDEQLARQLAGEGRYRSPPESQQQRYSDRRRTPPIHTHPSLTSSASRDRQRPSDQSQSQQKERSFIDDDLPVIKDNIKKGWSQLVSKVKSTFDGEDAPPPQPPRPGSTAEPYRYTRQQSTRYDADPRVLGDDFSHLKVQDSSQQAHRPLANPDLFKSTRFSNTENVEPPVKPPRPGQQTTSSTGQVASLAPPQKKWEPLTSAEDRDPFAVGDSDDEDKVDLYGTLDVAPKPPPKILQTEISKTSAQETGVISTLQYPTDESH
jgi:hypothetical protein